jgi:outer membrane lipoprotein SlyB
MDNYSCGLVPLGSLTDGKPSSVIKSLDQLQGSLFPMRIGARMSFRSQTAMLSDSKYDSTATSSCEVVSKGSAQELDSRLTGAAWRMHCQHKTIMPNNDNKMDNFSSDDYYLEDLGTQLSMIGTYNWSTKEYVLPKAGTQTLMVTEGDYGSRITSTYQYHHFAVGESQIAADATEWVQQNTEENRKLAEKQRQKIEREQAFARQQAARGQQAAQAERAKPANDAPTQAAQRPDSGIFGALLGGVVTGMVDRSTATMKSNATRMGGAGGAFIGAMADSNARTNQTLKADIAKDQGGNAVLNAVTATTQTAVATPGRSGGPGLGGSGGTGGTTEAQNKLISQRCQVESKQDTNQPQIDTLCTQAAYYMCLYKQFKDQAPQLKPQAKQVCQILKATYGGAVCKDPCNEAFR